MCALISMAVFSTPQNGKDKYLRQTLSSLSQTVDFSRHKLGVSVNGHTEETLEILDDFEEIITYKFFNDGNIGTANAINKIWQLREQGQHAIKMDDDIYIHANGWVDELEEVVRIDPTIGQAALKRTDIWENVNHENLFYKTTLYQLPHKVGERWVTVEITNHCIGSCVLHSSALLDKVGFLRQPDKYGLDDTIMSKVSQLAGFKNVFLPHIYIKHLDVSPPKEWQAEKEKMVNESWEQYGRLIKGYTDGTIPLYYNPYI